MQSMFFKDNQIQVEINKRRIYGKSVNMQKLNNTLLNNMWVKEEITRAIRKYLEISENESATWQNLL